ncbi:hypothetical protein C5B96_11245 [Subtercola sp. Z020]|uniref:hypothetical protein n=1 Tax=Subtercola sp. Z020 TaxID=2080582 RepID=UPI000CE866E0|nr:hypothetical protein [Subtercola sp. Z020]PPF80159.1 hypothetical protein C5B96_11245 [Subtercola sp. Z020]
MSDTNTDNVSENTDVPESSDKIEEQEDRREQAQVDESLEDAGLLPVPEATPADGQAPGA